MSTKRKDQQGRAEVKNGKKEQDQHHGDENNFRTPRSRSSKNSEPYELAQSFYQSTVHGHPGECLCKDCLCGRHLCKLDAPSLPFHLTSTYKMHYTPRTPLKSQPVSRPASAKLPETPLLTAKSTYFNDFSKEQGDPLERPKPENLLKCTGAPCGQLTSYKEEYPGHKGKNQYVPMNPELFRGGLQFNCSSTYSKEYRRPRGQSASNARPPDQLKMSDFWLGGSSYKNQFQNPQNHVSKEKKPKITQSQVLQKSAVSSNQYKKSPSSHFQTTYGKNFVGNKKAVCPAAEKACRIEAELSKSTFKDNSNFKGMDSRYSSLAKNGNQF